jgi:UDP-N-acetylglucosamine--N-acetylmuramyl-(pentapeptide) pyrophosphoryl-undecaprenol N-acetylglucosamine transferase
VETMLRILGAGGGTKGHAFPLQEILREIKAKQPETELLIAGVKDFEREIASQLGAEFFELKLEGLPRRLSFGLLTATLLAVYESLRLYFAVRKKKLDAVIITGGYTSFPAGLIALLLKKPLYLHEQNAIPGLANRFFSRKATKIFLSLPWEERFLTRVKNKVVLTGNPVRKEALALLERQDATEKLGLDPSRPVILAFGGSQGAQSINSAVLRLALWMLKNKRFDFQIILLTGRNNYEQIMSELERAAGTGETKEGLEKIIKVFPEWHEMGILYSACDLVISRAGASTVAEIIAAGKPAILVPYPFAADNHQYYNALFLSQQQAAIVVENEQFLNFESRDFYLLISRTLTNDRLKKAAQELKKQHGKTLPQAIIADIILTDLKEKKK